MENKSTDFFIKAAKKLNQANQELFKPEEDIVSFLVCKNSQNAIENYLRGYLSKKGVETKDLKTIESLFVKCALINDKFNRISLSDFKCTSDPNYHSKYCNEVSKVGNCLKVAKNIDNLLREEEII